MKRLLLLLLATATVFYTHAGTDPVDRVNPLMGTDSDFSLSNGNTYPVIARPWGMNAWTPQTGKMGSGWAYTYNAKQINGIKQTHQPSPWIGDYGQFALMATTGKKVFTVDDRKSWFSHKAEKATPYYYRVYLADHDITAEATPTERAARLRFTYPESDSARLIIDAFDRGSHIRVEPEKRRITGYTTRNSGGVPDNFRNWFVIECDRPFESYDLWCDSLFRGATGEITGNHTGAVLTFRTRKGEAVNLKVASSFISPEQAELNLRQEIGDRDFETIRNEGRAIWNKELSKVTVEGGTDEQQRIFYSCLYRTLLFPRKFHETGADGKIRHYSPYNGEIRDGYLFTDNGFWDTFRAVFPFFTLLYPQLDEQIMEGLKNAYEESGWLPEWASPGHRNCMIGSNSASIISDAYLKGIGEPYIDTLYRAMLKNSEQEGPLSSVGRRGVQYYNELGYVPYDVKINENAARTLEYAYADWCIWKAAEKLGRPQEETDRFRKRAENYRNLFDPSVGLMRGRNANGTFQTPFSPYKWGDAFTEGNSWHYTWSVFHDIEGLIGLMGGEKAFVKMLDSVFVVPPIFDDSYYGFPIHEIREMQIAGMGNYAHGNQPIQHMIYLYNYAGAPWKAQARVREVMDRLYTSAPDGYCGDEDNGQTSAWYVFSAMGFYPVCPGSGEYVIGSPLFNRVTLTPGNGEKFVIEARNNGKGNVYIRKANLNGKQFDRNYIRHDEIRKGGKLLFEMDNAPEYSRGTGEEAKPYSMSRE